MSLSGSDERLLCTVEGNIARAVPGRYRVLMQALRDSDNPEAVRELHRLVQAFDMEMTSLKRKVRQPWLR